MHLTITASLALICAVGATAAPSDTIDQYVLEEMQRERIPGLALGVYRHGDIVKAQGYGLANVELNAPVKPETLFQSGSVGKQFAATAVMMLVEQGKVGLEDSITRYFADAPESWRSIRVKNLLSHTSGLAEYESDPLTAAGAPFYLRLDFTEDELRRKIYALPIEFDPGARWAYRNTNYVVLGMLIRKVTGQFYGDFLADRIFKPLGMTATRIISEADIIPNRSSGYRLVKGELKNQEWVSPTFNSTADGALYFNVPDLAKWDAALYTERLLKKSSFDAMWTVFRLNDGKPNKGDYGFAWGIREVRGHRLMEHSGSWQGFTTHFARYVDDGLSVAVLTNLDSGHARPSRIAHAVAGLYDPALAPPDVKPIEDREPQVTAFFQQVIEEMAQGKAEPENFTGEAKAEIFPAGVKELMAFFRDAGLPKALQLVERKQEGEDTVYRYRAKLNDSEVVLRFELTKQRKIAEFGILDE